MIHPVPCECSKGNRKARCPVCTGQACLVCERNGHKLNLCTRCKLSYDIGVYRLYTEFEIPELAALDRSKAAELAKSNLAATADSIGGVEVLLTNFLELPYAKEG